MATEMLLHVINPKPGMRYYAVAQVVYPVFDDFDCSDDEEVFPLLTVPEPPKPVKKTTPARCEIRSCGKFAKKGMRYCNVCSTRVQN